MDSFTMLVPVKRLALAKSRLEVGGLRRALAVAFSQDALTAAMAAQRVCAVLVVTDDEQIGSAARDLGAVVLHDEGNGDLNQALLTALPQVPPDAPVAAICADLPCLTAAELDAALASIPARGLAFVPDAAGTGTTLVATRESSKFASAFGPGSRAAHLALGAIEVGTGLRTLRQDVDTRADLVEALRIGVGAHTRARLSRETS